MFNRLENLIGKMSLENLSHKKVIVFGLGGVGSFAAEALVRSGIGHLSVVDYDRVDESNINRQLIALQSTIGMKKTDIFALRAKDINPKIDILPVDQKVDGNSIDELLSEDYDFILDCIDDVFAKELLAKKADELDIPIMLAMGFANKMHPEMIQVTSLKKTSVCPLAKVMRRRLKNIGLSLDIPCVYSNEKPLEPIDKSILGSTAFVPSAAGLTMASYVIQRLIEGDE